MEPTDVLMGPVTCMCIQNTRYKIVCDIFWISTMRDTAGPNPRGSGGVEVGAWRILGGALISL